MSLASSGARGDSGGSSPGGRPERSSGPATDGGPRWGTGDPAAGTRLVASVAGALALGWLVAALLIPMSSLELYGDPRLLGMAAARAATLFVVGLAGVTVLRGERLSRIGWIPRGVAGWGVVLAAIPAALLFAIACPLWGSTEGSTQLLAAFVAMRVVSETVFFDAFVTRSLLVDREEPAGAIAIGAGLYGVWALSYADILDGTRGSPLAIVAAQALLIGALSGGSYLASRSIVPSLLVRAIVLGYAIYAGIGKGPFFEDLAL